MLRIWIPGRIPGAQGALVAVPKDCVTRTERRRILPDQRAVRGVTAISKRPVTDGALVILGCAWNVAVSRARPSQRDPCPNGIVTEPTKGTPPPRHTTSGGGPCPQQAQGRPPGAATEPVSLLFPPSYITSGSGPCPVGRADSQDAGNRVEPEPGKPGSCTREGTVCQIAVRRADSQDAGSRVELGPGKPGSCT